MFSVVSFCSQLGSPCDSSNLGTPIYWPLGGWPSTERPSCNDAVLLQGVMFTVGDYDGRTALHVAASSGHLNVVEYLLDEGASVHVRDRYGHTPLDDAVRFNHHDVIKLLVKAGRTSRCLQPKLE